jgi:hypothetical protein
MLFFLSRPNGINKRRVLLGSFDLPELCPSLGEKRLPCSFKDYLSHTIMPAPTPQATLFVFSELWAPSQMEAFVCSHWPPGVVPGHLRALLEAPPLNQTPYLDLLADVATCLVMSGHQRSLVEVLQEMGALPLPAPLPPIQVPSHSLPTLDWLF